MIAILDTNADLPTLGRELGCRCEQLLAPLTRYKLTRPKSRMFAVDNGAFSIRFGGPLCLDREKAAEVARHLLAFAETGSPEAGDG